MKISNCFIILISGLILVSIMPSCKKYEEGPGVSLRSKKERVANTWKVEFASANGIAAPAEELSDMRFEFTKDGVAKISSYDEDLGEIVTTTGKWEFIENKESIRITISDQDFVDFKILKLKEKELWLESTESGYIVEYHLIPA